MPYINFVTPPFPHFILAGDALYRPGDAHRQRVNIGIFDLIFVEYGELFITDANMPYHLRENDVLIIRPDAMHFGHKSVSVKTKFKWLHFRTVGEYNYSNDIRLIKGERIPCTPMTTGKASSLCPYIKSSRRWRAMNSPSAFPS